MKILDFLVHTGHQYEFCKLGYDISYISTIINGMPTGANKWNEYERPYPDNIKFISGIDINFSNYDLMVIHNSAQLEYAFVNKINIPLILLLHSYPPSWEPEKKEVVSYFESRLQSFEKSTVVYNSELCKQEWGLEGNVVIAGLDPDEWGLWKGGNGKIITVGNDFIGRPSITGWEILRKVREDIDIEIIGTPEGLLTNNFDELRNKYINCGVYFNSTIKSPNPRGRVEAAMSGCPIVSTRYDGSDFIELGKNGYYSNSPEELVHYIKRLLGDESVRKQFSKKIREKAIEVFNLKRYLKEWKEIIERG